MCLTGNMIGAEEAERCGLVARVYPVAELVDAAIATGEVISTKSKPVVQMCKVAVNEAYELSLSQV